MTCINCGKEASERFCAHCGQRTNVKRITFKESWYDFWSRIYGFDGMFPRTLRDISIRPGEAARKFIDGNRVMYYGPVGYFFLMITLYLIIISLLDVDLKEIMQSNQFVIADSDEGIEVNKNTQNLVMEFVTNNFRFFIFLMIPFNAIAAKYLFFRKAGLNLIEHNVLPLYIFGHLFWISIIGAFINKFTDSTILTNTAQVLSLIFFGYAYSNFISYQANWKSFVKGLLVYFIGTTFFILSIVILGVAVILIISVTNPEVLKMLKSGQ